MGNQPSSHRMFLSITARPDISLSPGPIYAESGGDVVLPKCSVIGYPPPVVFWTKLFDELPGRKATVKDHTLTITKADRKDAGTYICTATNDMGTSHAMTTLIINVVPQFTIKPPKKLERYHGQSVTLNCSADGTPVPTITWSRCKGKMPEEGTQVEGGQLRINSLAAKDSGVYTCSARSGLLQVETEVQLIVKTGKRCQIRNAEKYMMFNLRLRQKKSVYRKEFFNAPWFAHGKDV